jgi:hypothetical protein
MRCPASTIDRNVKGRPAPDILNSYLETITVPARRLAISHHHWRELSFHIQLRFGRHLSSLPSQDERRKDEQDRACRDRACGIRPRPAPECCSIMIRVTLACTTPLRLPYSDPMWAITADRALGQMRGFGVTAK